MSYGRAHHALTPPILPDALGNVRAGTIEAVERNGNVLVELGAVVCGAVAKTVDNLPRDAVGILFRLNEEWRNRADEDSFCHAAFAVLRDITSDLATACRMPDVDSIS